MSDPSEVPGLDASYAPSWEAALREAAGRCAPGLADLAITEGWAGLYENTPDASALIGESPRRRTVPVRHGLLGARLLPGPGDR